MNLINFSPSNYIRLQNTAPLMSLFATGKITFSPTAVRLLWKEAIGKVYFQISFNEDTGGLYIAPYTKPLADTFKTTIRADHYAGCSIKLLVFDLIKKYDLAVGNGRRKFVGLEIETTPTLVNGVEWHYINTK